MSPASDNVLAFCKVFFPKNPTEKEITNKALPKSAVPASLCGDSGPMNVTGKDP